MGCRVLPCRFLPAAKTKTKAVWQAKGKDTAETEEAAESPQSDQSQVNRSTFQECFFRRVESFPHFGSSRVSI